MTLSPMMQQYSKIKEEYKDCLLFYRLGDFYELFFDDAYTASRELELTLTGRNCGLEERAPMCGVPFHAADTYIARLVEKGYKVAICEQTEDPALAKGLVSREVIRVVTPGTLDILTSADRDENIYIMSAFLENGVCALAYADITTGELFATDFEVSKDLSEIAREAAVIAPRETILMAGSTNLLNALTEADPDFYYSFIDSSYYAFSNCERALLRQFEAESLITLGLDDRDGIVRAAGSLLLYLIETQKQTPDQITNIVINESGDRMHLDKATMRNLELLETLYDGRRRGSLLGVLDRTRTAMGGRLLKRSIKEPLNEAGEINRRLDAVASLVSHRDTLEDLRDSLKEVYDFERLTARVASMRANGKDMIALRNTLAVLPAIRQATASLDADLMRKMTEDLEDFGPLHDLIGEAIVEEPPFAVTEGGLIRSGYSEELDSLKDSIRDARNWIAGLEQTERERTGIKTIKVGFNKVFGSYIDVSRALANLVPDDYIRKQTLVNNERFITPELKEKETLVLSAEAKINALEFELFKQVRAAVVPYIDSLQRASRAVAMLDMLCSFADVAVRSGYVRPTVDDSDRIEIIEGRHPAVEQLIGEGMFVSNDTHMDRAGDSLLVITGPNMSGKSTYMRQTAIIVLMAQIGSFVPCKSAQIGVVDRVFTRIGASDNLAYGQSTFFIEMSELANILRNATDRSLIILDEIGRGTSTFDGLSIAWATIEYLSGPEHRIRTMFATHYHELTALAETHSNIRNLSVDVLERGSEVVFLHKIVDGPASKSYGIHVAKIAGVPREIRWNAEAKLRELESSRHTAAQMEKQLSFFDTDFRTEMDDERNEIIDEIASLDIDNMTPMQALLKLKEIQQKLDE